MHFEGGFGVPKDQIEAYSYYQLAESSDKRARESLVRLNKELAPEQIATAQKRTKELQKEIEAKMAMNRAGK